MVKTCSQNAPPLSLYFQELKTLDAWDMKEAPSLDETLRRSVEDLLDNIPLKLPSRIIDVGCGSGIGSRLLASRFPEARITALDTNEEVLKRARKKGNANGRIRYINCASEEWDILGQFDIVFSSGAFLRYPGSEMLFPRLVELLVPWGVLAVLMPKTTEIQNEREHGEPAGTSKSFWQQRFGHAANPVRLSSALRYSQLLNPRVQKLDIWETVYHAVLKRADPVGCWMGEDVSEHSFFEAFRMRSNDTDLVEEYASHFLGKYPSDKDGVIVYPLRHMFILAQNPITQHAY